jgi:hypothetical protein
LRLNPALNSPSEKSRSSAGGEHRRIFRGPPMGDYRVLICRRR